MTGRALALARLVQSSWTVKRMIVVPFAVWVSAVGCLGYEDDQVQFGDDFETGAATWTIAGDVTVVTTNHPGEHAARLGPGATMAHGLSIMRTVADPSDQYGEGFSDGNWIEYTTDCSGRPALSLEPLTTPPGGDRSVLVRLRLVGPPETDFARRRLMFPALPAFVAWPDDPDDPNPSDGAYQIRFASLVLMSVAPCRVDNLRVMVSGGTLGY